MPLWNFHIINIDHFIWLQLNYFFVPLDCFPFLLAAFLSYSFYSVPQLFLLFVRNKTYFLGK